MLLKRSLVATTILSGIFASLALASPENTTADVVLGQTVFTANQANQGGAAGTASTLNGNRGIFADSTGRLWITDTSNNRVLMFNSSSALTNGQAADLVLGQADFAGVQDNRGGANPAANTLSGPRSIAVDSAGHVYVADSGNKRILRYDPPFTNGMNAVQVFGQAGSFTTANQAASNAATANNLGNPDGVAVDSVGNVAVADLFLKRVLIFATPAVAGGDTTADIVIGQPNFAATDANQGGNPAANTLFNPEHVAYDAQDRLYVADQENNRILGYSQPLSTNMAATKVWGQPGFTTNAAATPPTATSLRTPVGVCIDPKSGNLYVADSINMRIMEFADPQNNTTATRVFGQLGDFTTSTLNKGGLSADTLNDVGGVSCDANGNLFAGDRNNNRALRFNVAVDNGGGGGGGGGGGDNGGGGGGDGSTATSPCGVCGAGTTMMMPLMMFCLMLIKRRR